MGEGSGGGGGERYKFVDSVDEVECFLRGVSWRERAGSGRGVRGVRTIAFALFAAAASVMRERGRLRRGGRRSAGPQSRGRGWVAYRSTKALVNGRFSNLYRTSARLPACPARRSPPPCPLCPAHISSVSSRPPLLARSSASSQPASQSGQPTLPSSAPPHHRLLQVSAQARGVPSVAPSIPWPSQKAEMLVS